MAHRLAPQVEFELDDIWYYVARESFYLLASHPYVGRLREDLRPGLRSFP